MAISEPPGGNAGLTVQELQAQVDVIANEVQMLKDGVSPLHSRLLTVLDKQLAVQTRKVGKWAKQSVSAAKKNCRIEMATDKHDHDRQIGFCEERGLQLLRYKFDYLCKTIPDIACHFIGQGASFVDAMGVVPSLGDDNIDDIHVDFDHAIPVIPDLSETRKTVYSAHPRNMLQMEGGRGGIGTRATLTLSCMKQMTGRIGAVTKDHVDFVPDGQDAISLPLLSLNYSLASLTAVTK